MFTDFSLQGPYAGQMQGVLAQHAPGVPVVSLMHDAPAFNPKASAYLLAGLIKPFPATAVFLCVVDPGVGGMRKAVALNADGRWFVGPDNGLLAMVARQAARCEWFEIVWRPEHLSGTFHGRDLFAPAAAMLARGVIPAMQPCAAPHGQRWPDRLEQVIYRDGYGNLITGIPAGDLDPACYVVIAGHTLAHATAFSAVEQGRMFWFANSMGLVEVAANAASAAELLRADVATPVHLQSLV